MSNVQPCYFVDDIGPTREYSFTHRGIDFGWSKPDPPIFAPEDCIVKVAGTDQADGAIFAVLRGNEVINGKVRWYLLWHEKSLSIHAGQGIKQHEQIGIMGRTGKATGVHLHAEVWLCPQFYTDWKLSDRAKYAVNPKDYLYRYPNQTVSSSAKDIKDYVEPIEPIATNIKAYTVVRGDTLSSIAKRYNTSIAALLALNPAIRNANYIFVGQTINLEKANSFTISKSYTVTKGDTLSSIAKRYNTTVTVLLALNPAISNANKIFTGQVINLP